MKKKVEKEQQMLKIAEKTLSQLGGSQFVSRTGAKEFSFMGTDGSLIFELRRNSKRIQEVRISYNKDSDLYSMKFTRFNTKSLETEIIDDRNGIYCDQLKEVFTEVTGIYC